MRLLSVKLAVFLLGFSISCKHGTETLSTQDSIGMPNAEGVPINFSTNWTAGVALELMKNLPLLAQTSNPDGSKSSIKDLPLEIVCEDRGSAEQRCRLSYLGSELKLDLAQFLFQTMTGSVFVRRGCTNSKCVQAPLTMWLKSRTFTAESGHNAYEIKVCRIDGLELGLSAAQPFRFLLDEYGTWPYKPSIHGFSAVIEEIPTTVADYDDNGKMKFDEKGSMLVTEGVEHRVISAKAGAGPFGAFPTQDCYLSSERALSSKPIEAKAEDSGQVPDALLKKAPGHLVKFLADVIQHIARESKAQALQLTMRCQNLPKEAICHMNYRGPSLTLPIPKYVTGIMSAELGVLRPCSNPGCKPKSEANIQLRSYREQGLEKMELCSVEGLELANTQRLPVQDKLFGQPDIRGLHLAIDAKQATGPVMKSFFLGVQNFGAFPTSSCTFR